MAGIILGINVGQQFNVIREFVAIVIIHPSVLFTYDRLIHAVLISKHRFDNPVIKVIIRKY